MEKSSQVICSNCGWADANALGLTNCPVCHADLIPLETEDTSKPAKEEKYSREAISKAEDEELDAKDLQ